MDEQQLQELEEQLYHDTVEVPEELEQLIDETAADTARQIAFRSDQTAIVEFLGRRYAFKAKRSYASFKSVIVMVVSDEENRKEYGSKYVPFTVTSEVDNNFTMVENLKAIVETFFRHVTGTVQAEEM